LVSNFPKIFLNDDNLKVEMPINPKNRQERAETIAALALGWLAADEERLGAFMAESGASVDDLRALASRPEVMAAIMDHVLALDDRVLAFAQDAGLPATDVTAARQALPGGEVPNWT
jgi:hypothetical protein